jgi:acetyl-CoA acetyltransferase
MSKAAAIVGIGETRIGQHPGRSLLELQSEAVRLAVQDAGMERTDVQGLYSLGSYLAPMQMHGLSLAEYLGLQPRIQGNFDVGGTVAFMRMACDAAAAIESGEIDVAVCVYGDNASTRRTKGQSGFVHLGLTGTESFEDPFGQTLVASYALLARRYLDLQSLDGERAFWPIAWAMRENAALNMNAAYGKRVTLEDYRASPMIAEPLRRLDCSPVVDGAGAFVLASRARISRHNLANRAVHILGMGSQATHKIVSQTPDLDGLGMAEAGRRAFSQAGLAVEDVDLVTVHDGFTSSIAITLEQLGFMPPGETGPQAAAGMLGPHGRVPTNTHGGLLGQGHVGGVLAIVEAVRQLRGEAGPRQVPNAEVAAISGNGNIFSSCGLMLLGKGV